jgi:hypothetical protein
MHIGSRDQVNRCLAAILVADLVDYSRPMGADEEGEPQRLNATRRELGPRLRAAFLADID